MRFCQGFNVNCALVVICLSLTLTNAVASRSQFGNLQKDLSFFFSNLKKKIAILEKISRECVCPGPIKYYEELGCTPIFKTSYSCCPMRYDCDNWKYLGEEECFVNGRTYVLNEKLRRNDRNPCDDCYCAGSDGWVCSEFSCGGVKSFSLGTDAKLVDCWVDRKPSECCPGSPICVQNINDVPICKVDGKNYRAGEFFVPSADPEMQCYCGPGYDGDNVEPFCTLPNHTWCNHVLRDVTFIRRNCTPIYNVDQSPKTDCPSHAYRCQTDKDIVINPKPKNQPEDPNMLCQFGNMTMQIGEELNLQTESLSPCIKCVCEVPPVPTCHRKSSDECSH